MERLLVDDLTRLHRESGPWDAVLFTGDLTQSGHAEEFAAVGELFDRLWAHFEGLGSRPVLVAVPGNHDLRRPSPADPRLARLSSWTRDGALQEAFWTNPGDDLRRVVDEAHGSYTAWWANDRRRPRDVVSGLLPGDFALTILKGKRRVGVLGLNSTFLQLTGCDYHGWLALHARQFSAAVPAQDGPAWTRGHDVCLLLTHHPPDWLTPAARDVHLRSEIAPAGEFAVHLFGHMHEPHHATVSEGGGPRRTSWQGPSLFGLESYASAAGPVGRIHGYSAGCLEWGSEGVMLTCWPRRVSRGQDGSLRFTAAPDYDLVNGRTRPELVSRRDDIPDANDTAESADSADPAAADTTVISEVDGSRIPGLVVIGVDDSGPQPPGGAVHVESVVRGSTSTGPIEVIGRRRRNGGRSA